MSVPCAAPASEGLSGLPSGVVDGCLPVCVVTGRGGLVLVHPVLGLIPDSADGICRQAMWMVSKHFISRKWTSIGFSTSNCFQVKVSCIQITYITPSAPRPVHTLLQSVLQQRVWSSDVSHLDMQTIVHILFLRTMCALLQNMMIHSRIRQIDLIDTSISLCHQLAD